MFFSNDGTTSTPPVDDTPTDTPPVEDQPVEDPPVENPPAEDPPAENPPVDQTYQLTRPNCPQIPDFSSLPCNHEFEASSSLDDLGLIDPGTPNCALYEYQLYAEHLKAKNCGGTIHSNGNSINIFAQTDEYYTVNYYHHSKQHVFWRYQRFPTYAQFFVDPINKPEAISPYDIIIWGDHDFHDYTCDLHFSDAEIAEKSVSAKCYH